MSELLIFGGTTEGRQLAEFCAASGIPCGISVTTEYGASLLPKGMRVHVGRLTCGEMQALILREGYTSAVDATHPYAVEATSNIRQACEALHIPCERLVRERVPLSGETAESMEALTALLNACDSVILSTLGSKAIPALTGVRDFRRRVWLRILPSDTAIEEAAALGFDRSHILCEKGPFTTEQNLAHIRKSGAGILVTKESGTVGGYPEKQEAARKSGIRLITLTRPQEPGKTLEEIKKELSA